jgi:hypothetical protein
VTLLFGGPGDAPGTTTTVGRGEVASATDGTDGGGAVDKCMVLNEDLEWP